MYILPLGLHDVSRCDECEHSAVVTTLGCSNPKCDNIKHYTMSTLYGEYNPDDIESMISYCMSLRGTCVLPSIMLELGWFTEAVYYGSHMVRDEKAKEICEEYGHDIDWYNPIISLIRMFVKYCEKEYGT